MKDKNRFSKLLASSIVSAILGATAGSFLTVFTDMATKKNPINPLYIVIFFAVLVTMLSFVILFRVETVDEYRYEVMKNLPNAFIGIEKESVSEFATALVKKASFVRVVGTARQDVIGNKNPHEGIRYLECLEARMARKYKDESDRFSYLRVVPQTLKSPLEKHIRICSANAKKTSNVFKYKIVASFAFYLSYQLFDDTDMLLIVDNRSHTGAIDNALCLWTRNKSFISAFTKHFDDAWG